MSVLNTLLPRRSHGPANALILISDVEDVKFVINFDYPSCSEDYVHRIGRTGRRQKTGTAYTFFTPNNSNKANDLIQVLKEANQVINPKLLELADGKAGGYGRHRGTWSPFLTTETRKIGQPIRSRFLEVTKFN